MDRNEPFQAEMARSSIDIESTGELAESGIDGASEVQSSVSPFRVQNNDPKDFLEGGGRNNASDVLEDTSERPTWSFAKSPCIVKILLCLLAFWGIILTLACIILALVCFVFGVDILRGSCAQSQGVWLVLYSLMAIVTNALCWVCLEYDDKGKLKFTEKPRRILCGISFLLYFSWLCYGVSLNSQGRPACLSDSQWNVFQVTTNWMLFGEVALFGLIWSLVTAIYCLDDAGKRAFLNQRKEQPDMSALRKEDNSIVFV